MRGKLLTLCTLMALSGQAQDFSGYSTGNYTGVNSVFFNPANIADSRYRWDLNLVSLHTFVGNNKASFGLRKGNSAFNSDSLEERVLGKNAGPSSGFVNLDLHGPSLMLNTGRKSAMALTTRLRVTANMLNLDGKLVASLNRDQEELEDRYTIASNENMRITVNAWRETGLSYARVLQDQGKHFLKGGLSLKYLAGVANGFVQLDRFKATAVWEKQPKDDVYLSNTTGRIATGFGGINLSDPEAGDFFQRQGSGLGMDLGLVYEFRPDHEQYKKPGTDQWRNDRSKYKWKASFALLDIGRIRYKKDVERSGAYDIQITGNERFYLSEIDTVDVDSYKSFFDAKPQYFTPAASNGESAYNAALPATLQAAVDYHLSKGFYASFAGQLPLTGKDKVAGSRALTSFTLTPRYEGRGFGFYLPLNYNSLTQVNAGISLRAGPLFIGSGSILTTLLGQSKAADFHVGIRVGGLQKDLVKKEQKAARREERRKERPKKRADNE
ncbi:DUF5723 family protein [Paraflavisolibacter sp. H34]|uniref:DUF5723 family protein n=1 Tax=Huijunlia imazamoxiresistens TaxID=3127457 RepID=UPI0030194AB6